MRSLIITDTETTGLDPATCQTIEVAIVVWDVASASIRESYSSLIQAAANDAEPINRIPAAALAVALPAHRVWARVASIVGSAEGPSAFVAHRAEFDRSFYPADLATALPWICSKTDIEWPLCKRGESCVGMALAHGVPVTSAHRAMTDALLIARTLERVAELGHDVPAMLARAARPKLDYVVADRSFDEARNALAKAAGFMFDKPSKEWRGRVAPEDVPTLGFAVREVKNERVAS